MLRKFALAYLAFLTVLLVVRNPLDLFGQQQVVVAAYHALGVIVHFVTFFILGGLMSAARWPIGRVPLVGLLVAYAAATELIQSQIPARSADLGDFLQDVAGLALGMLLYRGVRWAHARSDRLAAARR